MRLSTIPSLLFSVETFFVGEYTYYVLAEAANFKDSEKMCRENKAEFASFENENEQKVFDQVLQSHPHISYGIGYYIPPHGHGKWENARWAGGADSSYVKDNKLIYKLNDKQCSRRAFNNNRIYSYNCDLTTYKYMCKKKGICILYFVHTRKPV